MNSYDQANRNLAVPYERLQFFTDGSAFYRCCVDHPGFKDYLRIPLDQNGNYHYPTTLADAHFREYIEFQFGANAELVLRIFDGFTPTPEFLDVPFHFSRKD